MKRCLVIVGAAEEMKFAVRAAHEMGLTVFMTDGNPYAAAFEEADFHAVASTYDCSATLAAAEELSYAERCQNGSVLHIEGVMTLAADVPYTVAYVASHLGLPTIGLQAALNVSDKVLMKQKLQGQVPIPKFREVRTSTQIIGAGLEWGWPVVVKPVDSRGARGVQIVDKPNLAFAAYDCAYFYSPSRRVMVEEYLAGPQLSVEGFMLKGKAYVPAIFDRNYEYLERFAPFVVENGGEMPSRFLDNDTGSFAASVVRVMEKAALAVGIENGPIKGDLVVHEGQVQVIEIAGRLSGGFFGTVAVPSALGVDLVGANIRFAMGDPVEPWHFTPRRKWASAIRFAFPRPGTVKRVRGLAQILDDNACAYAHVWVQEGEVIPQYTHHPSRPAVVVAHAETRDEAVAHAKRLVETFEWEIM